MKTDQLLKSLIEALHKIPDEKKEGEMSEASELTDAVDGEEPKAEVVSVKSLMGDKMEDDEEGEEDEITPTADPFTSSKDLKKKKEEV